MTNFRLIPNTSQHNANIVILYDERQKRYCPGVAAQEKCFENWINQLLVLRSNWWHRISEELDEEVQACILAGQRLQMQNWSNQLVLPAILSQYYRWWRETREKVYQVIS